MACPPAPFSLRGLPALCVSASGRRIREPGRPVMRILSTLAIFSLGMLVASATQRVEGWIEVGGPVVIFALLFACGLGLPLPEDVPLIIGGIFAGQGKMNLAVVGVLAWCGIIGGDCVLYNLGRKYGLNITRVPFVGKHLTKERILKAERY